MEFRWIAILSLWTLLVGPLADAQWGRTKAKPTVAANAPVKNTK